MKCTVFHVGDGRAVTAGHCFLPDGGARDEFRCSGTIQWGVRSSRDGLLPNVETSVCSSVQRARNADQVDFAVIRLDSPPSAALKWSSRDAEVGLPIQVLGYPGGPPLSYPAGGCAAHSGADTKLPDLVGKPWVLAYKCDTDSGSSGSPVFRSDDWTVVGVHNGGAQTDSHTNDGWNWATAATQVQRALAAPTGNSR